MPQVNSDVCFVFTFLEKIKLENFRTKMTQDFEANIVVCLQIPRTFKMLFKQSQNPLISIIHSSM